MQLVFWIDASAERGHGGAGLADLSPGVGQPQQVAAVLDPARERIVVAAREETGGLRILHAQQGVVGIVGDDERAHRVVDVRGPALKALHAHALSLQQVVPGMVAARLIVVAGERVEALDGALLVAVVQECDDRKAQERGECDPDLRRDARNAFHGTTSGRRARKAACAADQSRADGSPCAYATKVKAVARVSK